MAQGCCTSSLTNRTQIVWLCAAEKQIKNKQKSVQNFLGSIRPISRPWSRTHSAGTRDHNRFLYYKNINMSNINHPTHKSQGITRSIPVPSQYRPSTIPVQFYPSVALGWRPFLGKTWDGLYWDNTGITLGWHLALSQYHLNALGWKRKQTRNALGYK